MKEFILSAKLLGVCLFTFFSQSAFTQVDVFGGVNDNGTGTGSGWASSTEEIRLFEDSIYVDSTVQKIKAYLDDNKVPYNNRRIRKTSNEYFALLPLKEVDGYLVIWSDYFFALNGDWKHSTTQSLMILIVTCSERKFVDGLMP